MDSSQGFAHSNGNPSLNRATPARRLCVVVLLILAVVIAYRIATFDLALMLQDQGRDLHYALRIASGEEFPLFGPWMSIDLSAGGSPVYYYVIALPLLVLRSPFAALVFANLFWWFAVATVFLAVRRVLSTRASLFVVIMLAISPELLKMTDTIWNPNLLAALTALTFSFALFFASSGKALHWYAFVVMASLCTHMHPLAAFSPLVFLPIVMRRKVRPLHAVTAGVLGAALALPLALGVIRGPRSPLTVGALMLNVGAPVLLVVLHRVGQRVRVQLERFYLSHFRLIWTVGAVCAVYAVAVLGADVSRPLHWLVVFMASTNAIFGKRVRFNGTEHSIELTVVASLILSFLVLMGSQVLFGSAPAPHYVGYLSPIFAIYGGVWLGWLFCYRARAESAKGQPRKDVLQQPEKAVTQRTRAGVRSSPRGVVLLRGLSVLGLVLLFGLGQLEHFFSLTGQSSLLTFGGAKSITEAILERFGDDERLFAERVFAYPRRTGQEDEDCAAFIYYYFLRPRYPVKPPTSQSQFVLILDRQALSPAEHPEVFLSTARYSLLSFAGHRQFHAWLSRWGLSARMRAEDFWKVPFYVNGYCPGEWRETAVGNDDWIPPGMR